MRSRRLIEHSSPMPSDETNLEISMPMWPIVNEMFVVSPVQQLDASPTDMEAIQSGIETVKPGHGGEGVTVLGVTVLRY